MKNMLHLFQKIPVHRTPLEVSFARFTPWQYLLIKRKYKKDVSLISQNSPV